MPCASLCSLQQADFVISLDAHYTDKPAGDDGLEPGSLLGRLMNTGVYFARARIQGGGGVWRGQGRFGLNYSALSAGSRHHRDT